MMIWKQLRKNNAKGNQIVFSGTAYYSFNHFAKNFHKWRSIIASQGNTAIMKEIFEGDELAAKGFRWQDYAIVRIPYTHLPEGALDQGILAQLKATLSRNQFLMEVGSCFHVGYQWFLQKIYFRNSNYP
jgi:hypothetical protein